MSRNRNANPVKPSGKDHPLRIGPLLLATAAVLAGYFFRRAATKPAPPGPGPTAQPFPRTMHTGYEASDASAGWIFGLVLVLLVCGLGLHFLLVGMLDWLRKAPAPSDRWRPVARPAVGAVGGGPTYPKLQVSPPLDLQEFRAREESRLNSYGWVNRTSGTVHIPIGIAMDELLKKGLPVRPQNQATTGRGPSSYEMQLQRVEQRPKGKEATP